MMKRDQTNEKSSPFEEFHPKGFAGRLTENEYKAHLDGRGYDYVSFDKNLLREKEKRVELKASDFPFPESFLVQDKGRYYLQEPQTKQILYRGLSSETIHNSRSKSAPPSHPAYIAYQPAQTSAIEVPRSGIYPHNQNLRSHPSVHASASVPQLRVQQLHDTYPHLYPVEQAQHDPVKVVLRSDIYRHNQNLPSHPSVPASDSVPQLRTEQTYQISPHDFQQKRPDSAANRGNLDSSRVPRGCSENPQVITGVDRTDALPSWGPRLYASRGLTRRDKMPYQFGSIKPLETFRCKPSSGS